MRAQSMNLPFPSAWGHSIVKKIADHARRGYAAGRLSADVFYRFYILTIRDFAAVFGGNAMAGGFRGFVLPPRWAREVGFRCQRLSWGPNKCKQAFYPRKVRKNGRTS